jgi:hypothetical protein
MNYFIFSFSAFDEFYMIFSSFANLSCSFLIFARQACPAALPYTAAYTNRRKNSCELLVFDCGLTPFCDLVILASSGC